MKANLDTEAEIAAMLALKQYLADKKILRLPIE